MATKKTVKSKANNLDKIFEICPFSTNSLFEQENFASTTGVDYSRYVIGVINEIRKIESDLENKLTTFERNSLTAKKARLLAGKHLGKNKGFMTGDIFLKELEKFNVPVLLGLFPIKNYGIAWYFNENIPGVSVPKDLLNALKNVKKEYKEDKKKRNEAIDKINIDFFEPFIKEIQKTTKAAGIHCMAVHYERLFEPLLKNF